VLCVAAIELTLMLATPYPLPISNRASHEFLGVIADSRYPDIDTQGFRNPKLPSSSSSAAGIWAIGDSFTYGYNVGSEASWPRLLESAIGSGVVNKGIGGYNFAQHYWLAQRGLEAGADAIIAIYLGNDLAQGVCETLAMPYWQGELSRLTARSGCADAERDKSSPLWFDRNPTRPLPRGLGDSRAMLWLVEHSASLSILYQQKAWPPFIASRALRYLDGRAHEAGRMVDIGTPAQPVPVGPEAFFAFAKRSMDLADEGIRANYELSLLFYKGLARRYADAGRKLGFLLIRTRVAVEYDFYAGRADINERGRQFVAVEEGLAKSYRDVFVSERVPFVDTLAHTIKARAEAEAAGRAFWLSDDDHPLEDGYRAYARAAADLVRGW
jgi:lysophospholipase L1-like esterase